MCDTSKSCSMSYTVITFRHYRVFISQYCTPPKSRFWQTLWRASSRAFLVDSGRRDGGAFLAAPLGTGLSAVAADSSGSATPPLGSCRLGGWRCCWAACRAAGRWAPGRGCPRATRPSCLRRRHLRRRWTARARSDRPARVSTRMRGCSGVQRTWMRFLPSGLVTSGCSLGVVNVYTRPVSDTTRSSTWVPVRTDSSYAWRVVLAASGARSCFSCDAMGARAQPWTRMRCDVRETNGYAPSS
jgi:hypothetical protein